jgi:hypothetical protein
MPQSQIGNPMRDQQGGRDRDSRHVTDIHAPRGSASVTSRKIVSGLKGKPVPRVAIVTVTSRKSGCSFDNIPWTRDEAPLVTSQKFTESFYFDGLPVAHSG